MMALKKKYSIKKKNKPTMKGVLPRGTKALSDSVLLIGKRYN